MDEGFDELLFVGGEDEVLDRFGFYFWVAAEIDVEGLPFLGFEIEAHDASGEEEVAVFGWVAVFVCGEVGGFSRVDVFVCAPFGVD